MLVIGDREVENGTVALRNRTTGDQGSLPVETLINALVEEIDLKRTPVKG